MSYIYLLSFSLLTAIGISLASIGQHTIGFASIGLGIVSLLVSIFTRKSPIIKLVFSVIVIIIACTWLNVLPFSAIGDKINSIIPHSQTEVTHSKDSPQSNVHSHTGFVKRSGTGYNSTGIVFQDGFAVNFVGALKPELLPDIGQKIKVTYAYNQQAGGNVLISLEDVR